MNKTVRRRISSTPNHSLVPSVAIAALEEMIAGTIPAAAARKGLRVASSAVLATPKDADV